MGIFMMLGVVATVASIAAVVFAMVGEAVDDERLERDFG